MAGDLSTSRKRGCFHTPETSPLRKEGGLMEVPHLPQYHDALVIGAWRRAVCLAQCITSVLASSLV